MHPSRKFEYQFKQYAMHQVLGGYKKKAYEELTRIQYPVTQTIRHEDFIFDVQANLIEKTPDRIKLRIVVSWRESLRWHFSPTTVDKTITVCKK